MILRPYQTAAVDTTWRYIRHSDGNPAIVIPTAGGKSLIMAETAKQAVTQWNARIGIVASSKELVGQNAEKMRALWPEADIGIYSASLKQRDRFNKILFLQAQSIYKKMTAFGHFDLLLFDEFHLVPTNGEGIYRTLIAAARKINPQLRVIGYSATPYRLGTGLVCGPENIFTDIAYEANVRDLIDDGYLCPLISRGGSARPDLSGVKMRGGEYVEHYLAQAVDKSELVETACDEMVAHAADRHSWIVFAVSIAHAEHVVDALRARGIPADLVHGETPAAERDRLIAAFKARTLRALVNVNVLTTGFDAPNIDCVVMLRPTKSTGLYVQMVGRGFRLDPSKTNTLVLDFAGNVLEFGPVDKIMIKSTRQGGKKLTTAAAKECPACSAILAAGYRTCPDCGHVFAQSEPGHLDRPVDAPVLSVRREPARHVVHSVKYERHQKAGKPVCLHVIYQCGLRRFSEYVCLEHGGVAARKAIEWWQARTAAPVPRTVEKAIGAAYQLPRPVAITVDENEKYPRIVGVEMGEVAEISGPSVVSWAPTWLARALNPATNANEAGSAWMNC